jgi:hypothetical protein
MFFFFFLNMVHKCSKMFFKITMVCNVSGIFYTIKGKNGYLLHKKSSFVGKFHNIICLMEMESNMATKRKMFSFYDEKL